MHAAYYIVICVPSRSTIFFILSNKQRSFQKEKKLLNIQCVLIFSVTGLKHLTLRRIEPDMIKMYIGLHVKYPLCVSGFNETYFWTDFRKIFKYKIS
jgi:hypothetical protein